MPPTILLVIAALIAVPAFLAGMVLGCLMTLAVVYRRKIWDLRYFFKKRP